MDEKEVIKRWGTPEQYYAEKERFLKAHAGATRMVFSGDRELLVRVEYDFIPTQVYIEHLQLIAALQEASKAESPEE